MNNRRILIGPKYLFEVTSVHLHVRSEETYDKPRSRHMATPSECG